MIMFVLFVILLILTLLLTILGFSEGEKPRDVLITSGLFFLAMITMAFFIG